MPRKKADGSLTGSKSFRKSKSVGETIVGGLKDAKDAFTTQMDNMVSSAEMSPEEAQQQQFKDDQQPQTPKTPNTPSGGDSKGQSGYLTSSTVKHGITIPKFDVNAMMGGDLYSAATGIPETGIIEATKVRQTIARQSNSLDIAADKVALTRKAVKVATEIRHLEGDAVDYDTAGIQTATKVVKNQQAGVEHRTEVSKLDQKEELLKHQQIATAGTKALTPLIQEEWNLRIVQKQSSNESLKLDVEKGQADATRKKNELEVKLIEATIV